MSRFAAALLLILALAACSRAPGLSRLAPGETAKVAEVRAGDAVVLDSGLVVRLAGVEAPKGEQPYAAQAKAAMSRLAAGQQVRLLYGGARRDHYGRALAQVTLAKSGQWLQQALLRQGAVRMRTWPDNRAMAAELQEAEAYARNRRLGLWALPAYRVLVPSETRAAEGFTIVEGKVRKAEPDALDIGGFTARIAPQAQGDFAAAGKAPAQLAGRLIRVRGYVRSSGEMALDHPEEIELLKSPKR